MALIGLLVASRALGSTPTRHDPTGRGDRGTAARMRPPFGSTLWLCLRSGQAPWCCCQSRCLCRRKHIGCGIVQSGREGRHREARLEHSGHSGTEKTYVRFTKPRRRRRRLHAAMPGKGPEPRRCSARQSKTLMSGPSPNMTGTPEVHPNPDRVTAQSSSPPPRRLYDATIPFARPGALKTFLKRYAEKRRTVNTCALIRRATPV